MKYTLLQLTQQVLSSISGDEVNSINDTTESQDIVKLIKRVYGNLAEITDYPQRYGLFGLTPSGDASKPTLMTIPLSTVKNLQWVKYDCKQTGETDTNFQVMGYVDTDEFFRRMHSLAPSADATLTSFTHTVNGQSVAFIVENDTAPSYYTTIDDETLIFDAYDSAVDTTLQTSKTLCYGELQPTWTESDGFYIPFNDHQLLLSECISLAWAEMKQAANAKAEHDASRLRTGMQRKKHQANPAASFQVMTPNYGRK